MLGDTSEGRGLSRNTRRRRREDPTLARRTVAEVTKPRLSDLSDLRRRLDRLMIRQIPEIVPTRRRLVPRKLEPRPIARKAVSGARPKGGRLLSRLLNPVVDEVRDPHRVALCVRRKVRREVLMAHGRGGGRHRKPKDKPNSKIRC